MPPPLPLHRHKPPEPDPPAAPPPLPAEEIERAACAALRVPYWADVLERRISAPHHLLGTFTIADNEAAVRAAVKVYNDLRWYHPDRRYGLLPIVADYDCYRRDVPSAEANFANYLRYLAACAPELSAALRKPIPLYAPEEPRQRHTYLLGTTRSGKSELLKTIIYSYATQPELAAIVALDPAGEFLEQVAHWPEFVGNDRLVFVRHNLALGMVPTINPLEISGIDPLDTSMHAIKVKRVVAQQIVEALEEIIAGGMGSAISLPMHALLMPCVLMLLDRPGSTLRDLQRFMNDDANDDLVAFGAGRLHHEDAADASFNRSSAPTDTNRPKVRSSQSFRTSSTPAHSRNSRAAGAPSILRKRSMPKKSSFSI